MQAFTIEDDSIKYKIYVSKAVPLADVNVTTQIDVLMSTREGNDALNHHVKTALNDFIPVPWEISLLSRESATPGYERIRIRAIAKVGLNQHNNLDERARLANREGLELSQVYVDRTLPKNQVNQIMKDLWFEAIEKVTEHISEFNRISGRQWRIGEVTLGIPDDGSRVRHNKGGYVEAVDDILGDLVESGLDGAEKVSLIANVILKSARPT